MNIFKSVIVLFVLVFLAYKSVLTILQCIRCTKSGSITAKKVLLCTLLCCFTIVLLIWKADCIYPFERQLEPELIGVVETPEDYPVNGEIWHGVYEKTLFNPPSSGFGEWHLRYFAVSKSEIPELELDKYSYVFTYGQRIKSLSYNVWDVIDWPTGYRGVKIGHMVLDVEKDNHAIYIYRIPKIAINNEEVG